MDLPLKYSEMGHCSFQICFFSLNLEKEFSWSTQLISAKWLGEEAEMLKGERCYQASPESLTGKLLEG